MYSVWVSLKENINCSMKSGDVLEPVKVNRRNCTIHKPIDAIFQRKFERERFIELNRRDPPRNIVEMIFRAASMRPEKETKKIERILKVKNSTKTLERCEEYREMVKRRARNQHKRHPRSVVDGNELLMFYNTTMSCCYSAKVSKISELCDNHECQVCRIIESGFETEGMKTNGILLNAISDVSDDEMVAGVKRQRVKRAVVVCRVIAGRVVNMVGGGSEDGFDSLAIGELSSKYVNLLVRNPSAVLPCFVIVFS